MSEKTIYIGNKPRGNYLQACYVAREKGVKELTIMARGTNILTGINVASILQRNGSKILDVQIGCEKKSNYPGFVSTIQITLTASKVL